ncbi:coiled-coil domain-containing protein 148 isoform X4 [Dromaius novaehollandiae]|uniref:coiled-coil domain-containing protein 148 isoform X4 n=1 Tax=Dromaius novaehollandiae TaxID=8790 RepID=UPI0031204962
MSELDHGTFFTTHRTSDVENLVVPMRNGLCSQRYKPIDYKHLYELATEEKKASTKIQLKVKKMEQISKINKEQTLLKQHHQVWWQEHKRLSENRQKAEAEIQTFLDEGGQKYDFFLDMWNLAHKLSEERNAYQTSTVVPIWQLRENLKFRLSEMQRYPSEESCLTYKFNPAEVLQQIDFVKKQQKAVLEFLNLESLALEKELEDSKTKHFLLQALAQSFEEENGLFHKVPSALLSLECPCPYLKTLVIDEYRKLASEYWSKLQEIDQQLNVIYRNMNWKDDDQWVYQSVLNQYPSDLQRRRTLYLDALQRYLPHKSRHDLIVHEKAWDHYRFTRNQRKLLILNWAQARKAFLLKAVTAVAEASAAREMEVALADTRRKQRELCADLKAKVKKYWAEKQLKRQEQEEKYIQCLEELRKLMAEQAIKDRERVKFRQALLEKRLLEKKELALQEAHEAAEKEKSLEALRQQVGVVAKLDPARAVSDTVASKARMGIGTEEEFVLQKPLFKLHTYNEQQIISDPRLRVELALREAGLHKTLYAKEILPKIPPLKLPRRDTESTAFKP